MVFVYRTFLLCTLFFLSVNLCFSQDGKTLFTQKCGICHTLGGGKLIGPDLKDVHNRRKVEWLTKMIKSSQQLINSGDADAVAVFNQFNKTIMPDPNLSDAEINSILDYIKFNSESENKGGSATAQVQSIPVQSILPANFSNDEIWAGQKLFLGTQRLSAKGPSCISCHHIQNDSLILGGSLAKDLSQVLSRYNNNLEAFVGLIKTPPFPAMSKAYENRAVTDDEVKNLIAFLKKSNDDFIYQHPSDGQKTFLYASFIGFLVLLVIIPFIWSKRNKGIMK